MRALRCYRAQLKIRRWLRFGYVVDIVGQQFRVLYQANAYVKLTRSKMYLEYGR